MSALSKLLAALALLLPVVVTAQDYTLSYLGNFIPSAINSSGQVVGYNNNGTGFDSVLYSNGQLTSLPLSDAQAFAINDAGQIVGGTNDSTGNHQAFIYSQGKVTYLGGGTFEAIGINASGVVVGFNDSPTGLESAFIYANGSLTSPEPDWGVARAINASGQIAGDATDGASLYANGTTTFLGELEPSGGSEATAINSTGQVVGLATYGNGYHAVLFSNGAVRDLGTLGGANSQANGINTRGQIVGSSSTSSDPDSPNTHAFVFTNGQLSDLNSLTKGALAMYVTVISASGINDAGQIVAYGEDSQTGQDGAFLLNPTTAPVPLPASAWLMLSALCGLRMFGRKRCKYTIRDGNPGHSGICVVV